MSTAQIKKKMMVVTEEFLMEEMEEKARPIVRKVLSEVVRDDKFISEVSKNLQSMFLEDLKIWLEEERWGDLLTMLPNKKRVEFEEKIAMRALNGILNGGKN